MKIFVTVLSIIILIGLAGCSGGGTLEVEENEVTLKILSGSAMFGDKTYFDRKYGDAFREQHPNIKLEYIYANVIAGFPTYYELSTLSEEIMKHQPDLIITNPSYYKDILHDGLLLEIPGTDASNLYPPVVDYLRTLDTSNGSLYGVTDEFFLAAVQYNKKLFDRYQVEYPTDGMSWEELFQIASKFPRVGDNHKKLYGLYFPWWGIQGWQMGLVDAMKRSAGLSYTQEGKFNLHTDEWKQLLSLVKDGYIQGYLSPTKDMDGTIFYKELFREDQAAMTYQFHPVDKGYRFMEEADGIGFVREPIGSSNMAASFFVGDIFSVNKQAAHPNEAMEFVRFINSDEVVRSNLDLIHGVPARTDLIPESRKKALSSILQLDVNAENLFSLDEIYKVNSGIPYIISFELEEAFKKLVNQKATLDEAITQIEKGAQSLLDEYMFTGLVKCYCPPKNDD